MVRAVQLFPSNFGSGYLICQYAGAGPFANNVVRYNISQDDGLKQAFTSGLAPGLRTPRPQQHDLQFERIGGESAGRVLGKYADPLLRKDGAGLLTDPARLTALHEYRLMAESPAIDAGVDLRASFGIDPGPRDYFGGPVAAGPRPDIGAHEFVTAQPSADNAARH